LKGCWKVVENFPREIGNPLGWKNVEKVETYCQFFFKFSSNETNFQQDFNKISPWLKIHNWMLKSCWKLAFFFSLLFFFQQEFNLVEFLLKHCWKQKNYKMGVLGGTTTFQGVSTTFQGLKFKKKKKNVCLVTNLFEQRI